MFNVSEILYGTLDALAKVYGLKVVVKICQQFIIDSISDLDNQAAPAQASSLSITAPVAKTTNAAQPATAKKGE